MALWRNDDFCIIETLKFWIHLLDVFAFYHSASSFSSAHLTLGILHLFLRRCASKCPAFFSANWHGSWYTSIANFCSRAASRGYEATNCLECNLSMLTMLHQWFLCDMQSSHGRDTLCVWTLLYCAQHFHATGWVLSTFWGNKLHHLSVALFSFALICVPHDQNCVLELRRRTIACWKFEEEW